VPAGASIFIVADSEAEAGSSATAASCSDSASHTYSTDASQSLGVGDLTTICATQRIAAQLSAGATLTITWTQSGAGFTQRMRAFAVTGLRSAALDRTAGTAGTGSSASTGTTLQTNFAAELLVGAIMDTGSTAASAGFAAGTNGTANSCATSGTPTYSALAGVGSGNPPSLFGMYCIVSAQGQYAAQAALTGNPFWQALLATYVGLSSTTTGLTSSANPSVFGQSVTFTAAVTSPDSGTPTGTVTFKDGSTTLGTIALDGSAHAAFSISTLAVGSGHSITAVYTGDSNFGGSTSSPLTQTVNQAADFTTVTSSLNPSNVGQSVTFTATVTVTGSGSGTPTGTVTFKDGSTTSGTGTLDGTGHATFSTTALTVGGHSITAVYGGDPNFPSSTSVALSQQVNGPAPGTPAPPSWLLLSTAMVGLLGWRAWRRLQAV
jgi:hypothetical protein